MRDLTSAILTLHRGNDRASAEQVLQPAKLNPHSQLKATWEEHIVNQAMSILDQRHHFLPDPQEREEHARFVNLIKHLSETKT